MGNAQMQQAVVYMVLVRVEGTLPLAQATEKGHQRVGKGQPQQHHRA